MSLRDLLPEGTFDEILEEAHINEKSISIKDGDTLKVKCPTCGKEVVYDQSNPFRPFCSQRCRLIELGAWANSERFIKGDPLDQDEDGGDVGNAEFQSCRTKDE